MGPTNITLPKPRGFAGIGLFQPKSQVNVGAALRAAGCYSANLMAATGQRYKRSAADTIAAYKHIPFFDGVDDLFNYVPFNCIPIAVDLVEGAHSLPNFVHPERAFYIFGPEDGTLGKQITDRCKHKLMIPTAFCMNLAASVNVVLYDRLAKQVRKH